jgi:hypothetical protein
MSAPQTPTGSTPGPWRVVERAEQGTANGRRVTVEARGCIIADVDWNTPRENTANAALIASAPDLLAEVTRLRNALRDCVEIADSLRAHEATLKAAVEQVLIASEDNGDMDDIDWNGLRAALNQ